MSEKQTSSEIRTRRGPLEKWYFKASIIGAIFAVVLSLLNFGFDHLLTKQKYPSLGNGTASAAASTEKTRRHWDFSWNF